MLFLLPAYLSAQSPLNFFAPVVQEYIQKTDYFFVENEKTARRVIKFFNPEKNQPDLKLFLLDKHTQTDDLREAFSLMKNGQDFGLLSEAGLPCIADPGNIVVRWCHENGVRVVPANGPSSIITALISSGFNGQQFSFNGYLPIEKQARKSAIRQLERLVLDTGYTQIFMETPYRNRQLLEDLTKILAPTTKLCIAANINDPAESILTKSIREWQLSSADYHKIPAVFVIGR